MHFRWPHTDLLAVLLDFLLAVGFEQGFHATKLSLSILFGFHNYSSPRSRINLTNGPIRHADNVTAHLRDDY